MDPSERETILIVDDHEDCRESLRLIMQVAGHRAIAVGSVEEALRAIETAPNLCAIILDLVMPSNGQKLLQELRHRAECEGVPIFVVTGKTKSPRNLAWELNLPPERVFLKPADPEVLIQAAQQHCAAHR